MRRVLAVLMGTGMLAGCGLFGGTGLSGRYMVAGTTTYGFEFDGSGTMYSMAGDTTGRGTYTVDGTHVRFCISFLCDDLEIVGDCLVQGDIGRYCREP